MNISTLLPHPNQENFAQLGTGLSQGLHLLAQQKLNQFAQQQQQSARARNLSLLGIPAEVAHGLAGLPEDTLKQYFEQQGFGNVGGEQGLGMPGQLGAPAKLTPQQRKEQMMIDKETKKDYDSLLQQYEASKSGNMRLNRMEQLIKHGSLPIAGLYNIFKKAESLEGLAGIVGKLVGTVGLGIQRGITSRDTEEFEKLSTDFIKDAKAFFGPRLTDADLNAFLQTIPTLAQTDAGKLRVINNLRQINKVNELKYKAGKEIIKANRGHRPANFKLLVDEAVGPQIDAIAEQFKVGA